MLWGRERDAVLSSVVVKWWRSTREMVGGLVGWWVGSWLRLMMNDGWRDESVAAQAQAQARARTSVRLLDLVAPIVDAMVADVGSKRAQPGLPSACLPLPTRKLHSDLHCFCLRLRRTTRDGGASSTDS